MKPRVIAQANDITQPEERFCTCCEKLLKGKLAWLELDQRTQTYHDLGGVPVEKSQGWFPFGMTCAVNMLKAHAKRTLETV